MEDFWEQSGFDLPPSIWLGSEKYNFHTWGSRLPKISIFSEKCPFHRSGCQNVFKIDHLLKVRNGWWEVSDVKKDVECDQFGHSASIALPRGKDY